MDFTVETRPVGFVEKEENSALTREAILTLTKEIIQLSFAHGKRVLALNWVDVRELRPNRKRHQFYINLGGRNRNFVMWVRVKDVDTRAVFDVIESQKNEAYAARCIKCSGPVMKGKCAECGTDLIRDVSKLMFRGAAIIASSLCIVLLLFAYMSVALPSMAGEGGAILFLLAIGFFVWGSIKMYNSFSKIWLSKHCFVPAEKQVDSNYNMDLRTYCSAPRYSTNGEVRCIIATENAICPWCGETNLKVAEGIAIGNNSRFVCSKCQKSYVVTEKGCAKLYGNERIFNVMGIVFQCSFLISIVLALVCDKRFSSLVFFTISIIFFCAACEGIFTGTLKTKYGHIYKDLSPLYYFIVILYIGAAVFFMGLYWFSVTRWWKNY